MSEDLRRYLERAVAAAATRMNEIQDGTFNPRIEVMKAVRSTDQREIVARANTRTASAA